jgi:hypothetical protein
MREMRGHIEAAERNENSRTPSAGRPGTWRTTATASPHKVSNFEAVPLAIVGHDLRQSRRVIQNARVPSDWNSGSPNPRLYSLPRLPLCHFVARAGTRTFRNLKPCLSTNSIRKQARWARRGPASLRPYRSHRDRECGLPCNRQTHTGSADHNGKAPLNGFFQLKRIGHLLLKEVPFPAGMNHIARSRLPQRRGMGDRPAASFGAQEGREK